MSLRFRCAVGDALGRMQVDATAEVKADGALFGVEDRRFPEGASLKIRLLAP